MAKGSCSAHHYKLQRPHPNETGSRNSIRLGIGLVLGFRLECWARVRKLGFGLRFEFRVRIEI